MTDRETGKLKGFGFCEFMDLAVAEKDEEVLQLRTLVSNMQREVAAASDKYVDATSSSRRRA